jgi:hypothetical protein
MKIVTDKANQILEKSEKRLNEIKRNNTGINFDIIE